MWWFNFGASTTPDIQIDTYMHIIELGIKIFHKFSFYPSFVGSCIIIIIIKKKLKKYLLKPKILLTYYSSSSLLDHV